MGKKGRKGADDWEKDFELNEEGELKALEQPAADDGAPPAAKQKKEKKGKKNQKNKKAAAFDSDEEDEPKQPAPAAGGDEDGEGDDEEEAAPVNQTKQNAKSGGKKGKGPAGGSAFALLNGDDDEEAEDEEDDEEQEADKEEEEEEPEARPASKGPVMRIAEVISVAPHPKADRLRVCQVDAGGVSTLKVVTNAQNVEEDMKVVFAPVGCTTRNGAKVEQAVLRGVESFGMLCSAHECGWVDEADGVLVVMPDDAEVGAECPEEPPEGAIYGAASGKPDKKSSGGGSKKKGKKSKSKQADTDSLFAALGGDDEAAEADADVAAADEEEEEEEAPEPAAKHKPSKKDKKKKKGAAGDVSSAFAALNMDEDEEQQAPAAAAAAVAVAEEEQQEDEEAPPAAQPSKHKKKDKKKQLAADTDSLFAALGGGEEEEEQAPQPPQQQQQQQHEAEAEAGGEEQEEEEAKPAKKEKKKNKKAYADIDVAALLAGGDQEEEAAVPAPAEPAAAQAAPAGKKGKKDKKKGKAAAAAEDDEDLDALLAELDGPKEQQQPAAEAPAEAPASAAAAAAGGKKEKKKKKGKGGAGKEDDDEDLDSILAELGAKPAEQQQAAAAAAAAAPAAAAAEADEEGDEEEGEGADGGGGGKEMSAAAKRKAKKKAKEKAKKGGGGEEAAAAEEEATAAAATAAAAGKGKKGGGGGGGPKVSAAVRRMQEALEAQRKAQEEAERLAEEQRIKEEEEERLAEEEEARKKEESERKRREKAERREQLKKEGKLLTGKAKEEAERRARAAQQFLKQAGLNPDDMPKKKPMYGNKKKPQKKKPDEAEAAAEAAAAAAAETAEEAQQEPAAAAAAMQVDEPAAAAAAAAAEGQEQQRGEAAADSWEDAADDWEAMDLDDIKLPGQQEQQQQHASEDEEEQQQQQRQQPQANGKAAAAAKAAAAVKAAAAAVAAAKAAVDEEDEEEEEGSSDEADSSSEEGSSSEDDSSDDDSSDESSSEEESSDSEDEREARLAAARERRDAKLQAALANRDPKDLRSPICCILGHVDTGKTKILDNIRRTNVQDGEAGGITQQIGATYIPASAVEMRTEELRKGKQFDLKLPGLLVIDTPGHESFSNLRSRGSGLCDIAVLVIDLMHGLEQQTIESINLLKMRKTPFIIAMNKVDRLYNWNTVANSPIQDSFARQEEYVRKEFDTRLNQVSLELNEQGLNVALYWKNRDPRTFINIVPTSAITGEGIPDLLQLVVKLTQSLMAERLMFVNNLESTVLEVKQIEGLGTTIDVVLVNGMLREGDTIVVCGLGGPIVTTIRALLTPQPMKEIRVKGQYVHHKELRAAMGVKIAAHNLESAVAGTQLYVAGPDDDIEDLKDAVMEDMQDIFSSVDKTGEGVCVQASTLGSLEALLEFLKSDDVKISVSSINIGPINKKDVMRANAMIERGHKKFGVILAFDVPVTREAATLAEQLGVRIFTADIIYHLFDQFTAYLKTMKEEEQEAAKLTAVFPCILKILPTCIFNQKDPIVLGVEVVEGIAKVGTPICVPSRGGVDLGRIASLEKDHKSVDTAKRGDTVAMKIESTKPEEASRMYERHFDFRDELVSRITRKSINVLKDMFRDELSKDDWRLVVKLKKIFKID